MGSRESTGHLRLRSASNPQTVALNSNHDAGTSQNYRVGTLLEIPRKRTCTSVLVGRRQVQGVLAVGKPQVQGVVITRHPRYAWSRRCTEQSQTRQWKRDPNRTDMSHRVIMLLTNTMCMYVYINTLTSLPQGNTYLHAAWHQLKQSHVCSRPDVETTAHKQKQSTEVKPEKEEHAVAPQVDARPSPTATLQKQTSYGPFTEEQMAKMLIWNEVAIVLVYVGRGESMVVLRGIHSYEQGLEKSKS